MQAVRAIRDETVRADVARALEAGDVQGALDAIKWEFGDQTLRAAVPPALRTSIEAGANEAAVNLAANADIPALAVAFDIVNPEAVAFVRDHGAELIKEFGQTSMESVRGLIQRTVAAEERTLEGRPLASPGRLARQIVDDGIGLLDRQLNSLERFRVGLEANTALTDARIDAMVARRAAQMLRYRSKLIARTEIMRAARVGNQALWKQALERGLLDEHARQVWHVEPGACDECEPLDGATAPIGEDFPDPGEDGPPLHPACRCTLTVTP